MKRPRLLWVAWAPLALHLAYVLYATLTVGPVVVLGFVGGAGSAAEAVRWALLVWGALILAGVLAWGTYTLVLGDGDRWLMAGAMALVAWGVGLPLASSQMWAGLGIIHVWGASMLGSAGLFARISWSVAHPPERPLPSLPARRR